MKYSELSKLSVEELRALNSKIIGLIKSKNKTKSQATKGSLYVGAIVTVNHPRFSNTICKVTKINRTKVVINHSWNVPMSMVALKNNKL